MEQGAWEWKNRVGDGAGEQGVEKRGWRKGAGEGVIELGRENKGLGMEERGWGWRKGAGDGGEGLGMEQGAA